MSNALILQREKKFPEENVRKFKNQNAAGIRTTPKNAQNVSKVGDGNYKKLGKLKKKTFFLKKFKAVEIKCRDW